MSKKQKGYFAVVLFLLILCYILVNLLTVGIERHVTTTLDLTGEKLYELSDTTIQTAKRMNQETTIYVIAGEDDYPVMLKEIISRYDALSNQIQTKYIDPSRNPMFLAHYHGLGYTLNENDILVEGAVRAKSVKAEDFITYDQNGNPTSLNPEQYLTAALLYVNSTNNTKAYFTTGHNESASDALTRLFQNNNFSIVDGTFAEGFATNPDLVIIAAPSKDFTVNETEILDEYLTNGGNVMLFLEPSNTVYKNLNTFTQKYNLTMSTGIIAEKRAYVGNNPVNIVPMYLKNEITSYVAQNQTYVVMPKSMPIQIIENSQNVSAAPLLMTTKDSYKVTNPNLENVNNSDSNALGPFCVAALAEKNEATLFYCSSRDMYSDEMLSTDSYANAEFLTRVMETMSNNSVIVSIPPKNFAPTTIVVKKGTAVTIGFLIVIIIPLIIASLGVSVHQRRKRL